MIDFSIDSPWLKVCQEWLYGHSESPEYLGEGPVIAGLPDEVKETSGFISLHSRARLYNDGGAV